MADTTNRMVQKISPSVSLDSITALRHYRPMGKLLFRVWVLIVVSATLATVAVEALLPAQERPVTLSLIPDVAPMGGPLVPLPATRPPDYDQTSVETTASGQDMPEQDGGLPPSPLRRVLVVDPPPPPPYVPPAEVPPAVNRPKLSVRAAAKAHAAPRLPTAPSVLSRAVQPR